MRRLLICLLFLLLPWQASLAQDAASPPGDFVEDPEGIVEDAQSEPEPPPAAQAPKKTELPATAESEEKTVPAPEPESIYTNGIVLQGLNKVTARIQQLDGPIGAVLRFGNLEIVPRRCWKSSPEAQPENAALLEIWELKPDEGPQQIFMGWMFSSSPGLSSLQHPVYDITVLGCENRKAED